MAAALLIVGKDEKFILLLQKYRSDSLKDVLRISKVYLLYIPSAIDNKSPKLLLPYLMKSEKFF